MENEEYDGGFPTTIDLWREKRELKRLRNSFGDDFAWEEKDETPF